jgi:hypothetical protein
MTKDFLQQARWQLSRSTEQSAEQSVAGQRIVQCPMGLPQVNVQHLGQPAQAVSISVREKHTSQLKGVNIPVVELLGVLLQEAQIELDAVAHYRLIADEVTQIRQHLVQMRSTSDILVADSRQDGDVTRDVTPGVHESAELIEQLVLAEFRRSDFDDCVLLSIDAGGLQVQSHVNLGHTSSFLATLGFF